MGSRLNDNARQLLSLFLPFLVVVVVPYWLLTGFPVRDTRWSEASPIAWLVRSVGAVIFILGLGLFGWCVHLFTSIGRGTLAPWDPTLNLVASGPYRFVRNPMISGVTLMLAGQALFWGSWALALWVCVFIAINHVYFLLSEEPGLEKRFGENYRLYKANVPRWLPRLRPWSGK